MRRRQKKSQSAAVDCVRTRVWFDGGGKKLHDPLCPGVALLVGVHTADPDGQNLAAASVAVRMYVAAGLAGPPFRLIP